MKLVTYERGGEARTGVVMDGSIIDVAAATGLPTDMLGLIGMGADAKARLSAISSEAGAGLPFHKARLLAPIPRPARNVFCLGLNYQSHREESSSLRAQNAVAPPEWPTYFSKAPTAVIGPDAEIPSYATLTQLLDWEVELGVIVGRGGSFIPRETAFDHVFGYTIINDVSARDIQRRHGGQWFKGKSLDRTCPMGPWIVTADEIPLPPDLRIQCRVNGVIKQDSRTSFLIFDIPAIISDLSSGICLEPGDVIATGTCAGVGSARQPPERLVSGDVVECEIERIGVLRNPVK